MSSSLPEFKESYGFILGSAVEQGVWLNDPEGSLTAGVCGTWFCAHTLRVVSGLC